MSLLVPTWLRYCILSRISSTLGVPLFANECTSRKLRVSFARLLVEVDITKPLCSSVMIESFASDVVELKVQFEWTPPFCKKCDKVGHNYCDASPKPKSKQVPAQVQAKTTQTAPVQKVLVPI